jgi:hypothetical protein
MSKIVAVSFILFIATLVGAIFANSPQQEVCNKYLLTQNAQANCSYGDGLNNCGDISGLWCCSHQHAAMTWDSCIPAGGITNKKCGEYTVRKPHLTTYTCQAAPDGTVYCQIGGMQGPCKDHPKKHDVLENCGE